MVFGGGQPRAGLVDRPIAVVFVNVAHWLASRPLLYGKGQGVIAVGRYSERGAVEAGRGAIDVLRARGRPEAVPLLLAYLAQGDRGVFVVLFDVGPAACVTLFQRSIGLAPDAEDVGQRPGVIHGLDGEEGHFDVLREVLGEHALPLLSGVGGHALLSRWVHLIVRDLHEVLEQSSVAVLLVGVVHRIQEDA